MEGVIRAIVCLGMLLGFSALQADTDLVTEELSLATPDVCENSLFEQNFGYIFEFLEELDPEQVSEMYGADLDVVRSVAKVADELNALIVARTTTPYVGELDARPKTGAVKVSSLKVEDARYNGLVGWKGDPPVDDPHVKELLDGDYELHFENGYCLLRHKNDAYFLKSDLDLQRVMLMQVNNDGKVELVHKDTNDEDFGEFIGRFLKGKAKAWITHGANDDYWMVVKGDDGVERRYQLRNPDPKESFVILTPTGRYYLVPSVDWLRGVYENLGHEWPYPEEGAAVPIELEQSIPVLAPALP